VRRVDRLDMETEEHPEEGRWVWRLGAIRYEAMRVMDGVVVLGAFINGEQVRLWDEPEGEA
jgi:hypothetical protein